MQLSENARRVLQARYLRRDSQGHVNETPEQLFARVARAIAHAELLLGDRAILAPSTWPILCGKSKGKRPLIGTCAMRRCFSIAPTGTLAILANTSSSIEPLFALSYRRVGVLGEQILTEYNSLLHRLDEHLGFLTPELLAVVATRGALADTPQVPPGLRELFATALEIPPRQHLLIQQVLQAEVDNAVSKTMNLPTAATPEAIASVYRDAYALGLKGITIYRSGSFAQQVLQLGVGDEPYAQEFTSKCDPY